MSTHAAATRSNLVKLRRRLVQVQKGAALLRRKRESLVTELFNRARPAIDGRKHIDEQALKASRSSLTALARHGAEELRALGWPARELNLELEAVEVWGLRAVDLKRSHAAKRGPANSTARAHYTRPVASTEESLETVGEKKEDEHVAQRPGIILR